MFGKLLCKLKHLEVSNVGAKMLRFFRKQLSKNMWVCKDVLCKEKILRKKTCVAKEFPRTCVPEKMQQTPEDI